MYLFPQCIVQKDKKEMIYYLSMRSDLQLRIAWKLYKEEWWSYRGMNLPCVKPNISFWTIQNQTILSDVCGMKHDNYYSDPFDIFSFVIII